MWSYKSYYHFTFGRMLKRWGLVYVANFVESILIALLFVFSGLSRLSDGALGAAAVKIAYGKVNLPFIQALLRGIGCNWLVCLAVWMALAAWLRLLVSLLSP